ncbi:copper resistance CopC/CopD family protein [Streptomyces sp. NRRL F-5123]|uniref:copper resistance CopC/CopD family protein n=1 Tax=Streptomyces sp. NRRL F-5123 TaxID=1463856 RepID=UPI0004E1B418|nr:copper resistance protein CopC [Streptomyces sp. NRRL F-5123]
MPLRGGRAPLHTLLRRLAAGAALAVAAVLAPPGTAGAHADLVRSSPADGAVLSAEPRQVTLVFSEEVALRLSSVRVIGPAGRRVDEGPPTATGPGGDGMSVRLAPEARPGTYVLSWRTTATDDGHTTTGALAFSVGAPSATPAAAPGSTDRLTGAALDAAVWLGFAGLAAMVGFTAVRASCLPRPPEAEPAVSAEEDGLPGAGGTGGTATAAAVAEGPVTAAPGATGTASRAAAAAAGDPAGSAAAGLHRGELPAGTSPRVTAAVAEDPGAGRARSATGRLVGADVVHAAPGGAGTGPAWAGLRWPAAVGWGAVLAGAVAQLLVHGPAAQGLSLAHVRDRSLLSATLSTHEGHTLVARLMLLALTAVVGEQILRHRRAGAAGAVPLALLLALTWSETSHAPGEPLAPLAMLVTALHVTAMAVWAGGVATLAVLLVRHRGPELATAARRFTRLALAAVGVLIATGTYQAWRLLGSFGALTGTHYGRLLLLKSALVLAVLAVAALRHAHGRPSPAAPARTVLAELAGLTAVLVVTVLLTSTAPAAHTAGAAGTARPAGTSAPR